MCGEVDRKLEKQYWDSLREDMDKRPSYLFPVMVALFGVFYILVGLPNFFLGNGICRVLFAYPAFIIGSFFVVVGVSTRVHTQYTEPFGASAMDRAIITGAKNLLAAIALVFGLLCCLGCLAFL